MEGVGWGWKGQAPLESEGEPTCCACLHSPCCIAALGPNSRTFIEQTPACLRLSWEGVDMEVPGIPPERLVLWVWGELGNWSVRQVSDEFSHRWESCTLLL